MVNDKEAFNEEMKKNNFDETISSKLAQILKSHISKHEFGWNLNSTAPANNASANATSAATISSTVNSGLSQLNTLLINNEKYHQQNAAALKNDTTGSHVNEIVHSDIEKEEIERIISEKYPKPLNSLERDRENHLNDLIPLEFNELDNNDEIEDYERVR